MKSPLIESQRAALAEQVVEEQAKVAKMRSALERIAQLEQGWAQAPALAREVLAEVFGG
jgi:hypothetical protein